MQYEASMPVVWANPSEAKIVWKRGRVWLIALVLKTSVLRHRGFKSYRFRSVDNRTHEVESSVVVVILMRLGL